MKYLKSLTLLILIHFSMQIPKYVNCPKNMMINDDCECCEVTCWSTTEMTEKACALFQCAPEKQIGYHEVDKTKEYPDCCGYPICNNQNV